MAAKADRLYFENLVSAADKACIAADYLVTILSDFHYDSMKEMMATMHEYEHAGDSIKHEMENALAKAFVTPVDREDLAAISHNIDDVTDSIEEVLQCFYMYRIKTVTPGAVEFAKKIADCCKQMKVMLGEFVNFKKPEKLHQLVVDLNHMEEECDILYIEATMALEDHFTNPLEIVSWRDVFNRMENCADACEHVGDCVDMVVMKNS